MQKSPHNRQQTYKRKRSPTSQITRRPIYVDPPISDITYSIIVDGTSNYVDTLFEGNNMEKILREIIAESGRSAEVGWLPSSRLDQNDIEMENQVSLFRITQKYLNQDMLQQKKIYIANLAVSKNNGHNHYCAFWIDKVKRVVKIWDSATSASRDSAFTRLFKKAATLIFKDEQHSTRWADVIQKVTSTTDYLSFQHGGGYLGTPKSLLSQNIFCHTWTLFFLELSLNKKTPKSIGCVRGTHPLLPLIIIKLYSQCLLNRMSKNMSDKYVGLKYVWDTYNQKAIRLPILKPLNNPNPKYFYCAKRVVATAINSIYYVTPKKCKNIVFM